MSLVKWVHPQSLVPKTQPDLYTLEGERLVEVIPLTDLAEVVDGLQALSQAIACDGPGCSWCERETTDHPLTQSAKLAQRLLAQLAPEGE